MSPGKRSEWPSISPHVCILLNNVRPSGRKEGQQRGYFHPTSTPSLAALRSPKSEPALGIQNKTKQKYDITELVNILQPVLVKWPTRHSQPQSLLLKSYLNDGGFTCALFQRSYLEKCIFLIHVYITALMWGLSYACWFDNYFLIFLGTYLEIRKELREIHTVLLHNCKWNGQ